MPARRPTRRKPAKSPVAIAIGKVLRAKREALDISQEQFAEQVSLSKNYVGNIERGEYEGAIRTRAQIAGTLEPKPRRSSVRRGIRL